MFYLLTIISADILIALANFIFDGSYTFSAFLHLFLFTSLGVIAVIAVDGILAFIARRLPGRYFAPEAKLFTVSKSEQKFYRWLRIKSWKKYVPELGCFTGFHKDSLKDPTSSEYVGRFLLESNYGVLGHVLGALLGFLIMLLPFLRPFSVALPIAIVNFVLSTLPTMILRFNTPYLRNIYRRALSREKQNIDK